jgi:SAM-dependent methyltransferase
MPQAGMVHALQLIRQLLKPDGLLVDIHPTHEPAAIDVRLHDRSVPAGWITESDDYVEYEWADEALDEAVNRGWFALDQHSTFEFVWHADRLSDLRAFLAEEWKDAIIDDVTAMRIEEMFKSPNRDKEILVREAIGIARYRRL